METKSQWDKDEQRAYLTCTSCGDKGYYPMSRDWWWKHTSFWHSVKWSIKRRLHLGN